MEGNSSKTEFAAQVDAPEHDGLARPDARDEAERKIVEACTDPSRMVYVLLAASPLSLFGTHFFYARGSRGCAGCLGFFAVSALLSAAIAGAFLLGWSDLWIDWSRGSDPKQDPRSAAVGVVSLVAVLWFIGICSAVTWTFRGSAAWKRRQLQRAAEAIAAKRDKELKQAADAAQRANAARARREIAAMMERDLAERERQLVPLYGGDPSFPGLVREGRVAIGMTRRAVDDALGEPADAKSEVSTSGRKDRLYFKERVGDRGKVSYGLELTLVDGLVTKIKDL